MKAIDPAALRELLEAQRERIFSAIGVVQLVGEEVVDDPDHGDTAYGALKAAEAQLQAAHDDIYNWSAEHLGETRTGHEEVQS